jgi:hypothetical protein
MPLCSGLSIPLYPLPQAPLQFQKRRFDARVRSTRLIGKQPFHPAAH